MADSNFVIEIQDFDESGNRIKPEPGSPSPQPASTGNPGPRPLDNPGISPDIAKALDGAYEPATSPKVGDAFKAAGVGKYSKAANFVKESLGGSSAGGAAAVAGGLGGALVPLTAIAIALPLIGDYNKLTEYNC